METKPDKAVSIIECDMNVRPSIAVFIKGGGMQTNEINLNVITGIHCQWVFTDI